ncbi:MAG: 4Fe-4S binding protein, partial [Nitrospinota bacterium]
MEIDKKRCVGCGNCVPYCTMGVIHLSGGIAEVNEEECVECSTCYRSCPDEGRNPALVKALRRLFGLFRLRYEPPMGLCPTGALVYPELEWPR